MWLLYIVSTTIDYTIREIKQNMFFNYKFDRGIFGKKVLYMWNLFWVGHMSKRRDSIIGLSHSTKTSKVQCNSDIELHTGAKPNIVMSAVRCH